MPHLFISHAKKDTRELALDLANALNAIEGISAWVDSSLRAGRAWEEQIETAIDRCDAMIVLLSPDINRHKQGQPDSYVLNEIAYAQDKGKLILPVMAQKTDLPISLIRTQYIDYTRPSRTLDYLVEALCNELQVIPEDITDTIANRSSLDLMPVPFAWIEIPGKGYSIAKYPVTNIQYARFIGAQGYHERTWWTEAGWKSKEEGWYSDGRCARSDKPWSQPCYWKDSKCNDKEQPVVGISWYEAAAFCLWLTDATGETIMLPTEKQWRYAAQGDEGRIYPWGYDWDCERCNNSVPPCSSKMTTPVRQYEGIGDSPFGVVDMAGNVWEWCISDHTDQLNSVDQNTGQPVYGGHRKLGDKVDFRSDERNQFDSYFRFKYCGFRIVRIDQ
jgi:formylglycine-generating enzyme required for sulfatase activity